MSSSPTVPVPLFAAPDYQAEVQARYERVQARVQALLPAAQLEHVGASSIPGAVSKGDLDIAVLVPPAELERCVQTLIGAGYTEQQDTLRTPELCMLNSAAGDADEHALQLVAAGSSFATQFLAFRDRLRADPAQLAAYNALKLRHAGEGPDGYRAAKARFIEALL